MSAGRSHDAMARKRERDKQNQRKKRDREQSYKAYLEARIVHLEQKLQIAGTQPLSCAVLSSETLSTRSYVMTPVAPLSSPRAQQNCFVVQSAILKDLLVSPEWLRLPLWNVVRPSPGYRFLHRGTDFRSLMSRLRNDPALVKACTPIPRTLDLLYGGSSNLLANFVNSELSTLPLLPPEKYASAHMIYLGLRWLIWPTKENFYSLPGLLRPTVCQLVQEHHLAFDFVPWPQMRDNFIQHRAEYDLEHVLGLFACTFRIRGWFGREFVHRENDAPPEVLKEFVDQFMDGSRWCLLEKFWLEYPDLVEGLDPDIMFREEHLSPGSS